MQVSAEVFRLELVRNIKTHGKYKGQVDAAGDTATNISRDPDVFNKYVKPDNDLEWDQKAMDTHKLTPNHPSILNASNIETVWNNFVRWVDSKVGYDETAILVAWHGAASDMKWVWRA